MDIASTNSGLNSIFESKFKDSLWANTPVESLGGKTWMEQYRALRENWRLKNEQGLSGRGASKNHEDKILKLAKLISNLGLEESKTILKLMDN
jgi:hypothetical protein